ncbi:IclR family transcriptional regulator [Microtetraspora malaysiensis]|uniref:IclR family transcriptional regulator n=1 Tax=Microtetraspora malaysiensis TaxID=161358 RepID=UPI0014718100|nr:IclR family transcriptional regulator [Microtetraspora malaysiensis]
MILGADSRLEEDVVEGPVKPASLQGVDRVLTVLEAFVGQAEWRVSDLAKHLGMHKAVTHRIVRSLEARQFLEQAEARGSYSLGSAAVALGRAAGRRAPRTAARRHLIRLAEQTGEVVLFYTLRGHRYVCVERLDINAETAVTVEIGDTIGLNAGAGKTLLAFQDERFIQEVLAAPQPRYTDRTPTDPAVIHDMLDRIRAEGVWISEGEITPHTVGVSAPVWDTEGSVRYCVCVTVLERAVDERRLASLSAAVQDTATAVSQSLGYREGGIEGEQRTT